MSREIKFRVWDADTADPKMVEMDPVLIHDNGLWWGANDHIDDDKSCVIMQYTGLKDRNGVEIYEGDLVECPCWDADSGMVDFNGMQRFILSLEFNKIHSATLDEVIFFNGSFCIETAIPKKEIIPLSQFSSICRVAGNIYQHSHLLNNAEKEDGS